jgi:hypothetical protein
MTLIEGLVAVFWDVFFSPGGQWQVRLRLTGHSQNVHSCMYVSVGIYLIYVTYVQINVNMHMYNRFTETRTSIIHTYINVYTFTYMHTYIYMFKCTYKNIRTHTHTCIQHMHIFMYTYTHAFWMTRICSTVQGFFIVQTPYSVLAQTQVTVTLLYDTVLCDLCCNVKSVFDRSIMKWWWVHINICSVCTCLFLFLRCTLD